MKTPDHEKIRELFSPLTRYAIGSCSIPMGWRTKLISKDLGPRFWKDDIASLDDGVGEVGGPGRGVMPNEAKQAL
jgi:hypothetical protein